MSKFIVRNDSKILTDTDVFILLKQVCEAGKISGSKPYEQYCYGTSFVIASDNKAKPYEVMVWCSLDRRSGTMAFRISDQ